MNINRNSFVITVAYLFTEGWQIPERTSLCVLFWRVVGTVAMSLLGCFLIGLVLGALGAGIAMNPLAALPIVSGIAIYAGLSVLYLRWYLNKSDEPKTLAGKYFRAVKERVCPVVNIVRETKAKVKEDSQ